MGMIIKTSLAILSTWTSQIKLTSSSENKRPRQSPIESHHTKHIIQAIKMMCTSDQGASVLNIIPGFLIFAYWIIGASCTRPSGDNLMNTLSFLRGFPTPPKGTKMWHSMILPAKSGLGTPTRSKCRKKVSIGTRKAKSANYMDEHTIFDGATALFRCKIVTTPFAIHAQRPRSRLGIIP